VTRLRRLNEMHILSNGVRRSLVPMATALHLRWDLVDELVQASRQEVPAGLEVAAQGMGFVLRQHVNLSNVRVDAVAQRKVDDSIDTTERHGWFRAGVGQRSKSASDSTGHDEGENVFRHGWQYSDWGVRPQEM